jgi:hypothetical protein
LQGGRSVGVGTEETAPIPNIAIAHSPIFVPDATRHLTQHGTAKLNPRNIRWEKWRRRPRYARKFIWEGDEKVKLTSAVPQPLFNELHNVRAISTITRYKELSTIVTPINVDAFAFYLKSHPNQPFVKSVCMAVCGYRQTGSPRHLRRFLSSFEGRIRLTRPLSANSAMLKFRTVKFLLPSGRTSSRGCTLCPWE